MITTRRTSELKSGLAVLQMKIVFASVLIIRSLSVQFGNCVLLSLGTPDEDARSAGVGVIV